MSLITVTNHGPLITATNYWDSEYAAAGKVFVSVNAGAIRVLLPPQHYPMLEDMRQAQTCVVSRGPWPDARQEEAIEIMWDDGSESPLALHLTPESFDMLPGEPAPGREWVCSVWTLAKGAPHKALERVCHWRRVERIPWMKAWEGKP